ncbi:MAG: ABC transporter substrate-binding protein [Solirubrobacterales bacterium]
MSVSRLWRRRGATVLVTVLAALAVGLVACGGDDDDDDDTGDTTEATTTTEEAAEGTVLAEETDATFVLDFLPNAVHAGVYTSLANNCYADRNINLDIIEPTSTADTLKLIDAGQADFGVVDGIEIALQINEGLDIKGIMAMVQRPQGAVVALEESGITDPPGLNGETVGVTGIPSDEVVLNTVMTEGGGDFDSLDIVTTGFNGVQNLLEGKVSAFTGFGVDAVQVEVEGDPTTVFRLDEFGGPQYPGLTVFSTQNRIDEDPDLMAAFVECTVDGYNQVIEDPAAGLADLLAEVDGLDEELQSAWLDFYLPQFVGNASTFGELQTANLDALSDWLVENELIGAPIPADQFGTNEFVPGVEG